YTPGTTYTMRVTVNADAGAAVYGFQAVALLDSEAQAGDFTPGTGTQVTTLSGLDYIEQSEASQANVFELEWTAPANSSGDVSFYAAGMAGNGNGSSGGDGSVFLTNPVVLGDGMVATQELPALATDLTVYPNPVENVLNVRLELAETTMASVRVYNQMGQQLQEYNESLNQGENQLLYDVSDLPTGQYVLEISNGEKVSVRKLSKQ
ncbi:MAG: choice-of-anchor V domain-containing protein, partial [Bacteroidota bacterium]